IWEKISCDFAQNAHGKTQRHDAEDTIILWLNSSMRTESIEVCSFCFWIQQNQNPAVAFPIFLKSKNFFRFEVELGSNNDNSRCIARYGPLASKAERRGNGILPLGIIHQQSDVVIHARFAVTLRKVDLVLLRIDEGKEGRGDGLFTSESRDAWSFA